MLKKIVISAMLMPSLSVALFSAPALANWGGHGGNGGDNGDSTEINVSVSNGAVVTNVVGANADTGDNNANGDSGGSAGSGGDANGSGSNTGGDGGNGGAGGDGGDINTGDATAAAAVSNIVNTNDIEIDVPCNCDDDGEAVNEGDHHGSHGRGNDGDSTEIDLEVSNGAIVTNLTGAKADTGDNTADGEEGGEGGSGGDADNDCGCEEQNNHEGHHGHHGHNGDNNDDSNTGGDGGNGGAGGDGGVITTGDALSLADVINVINSNIIRILR